MTSAFLSRASSLGHRLKPPHDLDSVESEGLADLRERERMHSTLSPRLAHLSHCGDGLLEERSHVIEGHHRPAVVPRFFDEGDVAFAVLDRLQAALPQAVEHVPDALPLLENEVVHRAPPSPRPSADNSPCNFRSSVSPCAASAAFARANLCRR